MLFTIFLLATLANSIQCSIVSDSVSQKGIHVSDYCPKMKYCPEGAHVMCMYYDPKRVMGPKCRNPHNVTITTEFADKLIDISNGVRSKIARGEERGQNGDPLPRGYGIFRLKWDSELATFAQILANKCVLRHDLCRSTKKFPDPGQTAGLVRFSYPDWISKSKTGQFTQSGLTEEKIEYAITQIVRNWYGQKSFVTVPMITSYPDWTQLPDSQGRLYLEMIYGSATHMGCGISAYTEYVFKDNNSGNTYNSIQLICNFSARPHAGVGVINTVPPTDTGSTFNACGCPVGSYGDDDCLCLEIPKGFDINGGGLIQNRPTASCPPGSTCEPTVVILPIFTVEDAPPDKLISADRFLNSTIRKNLNAVDIIDSFEELMEHQGVLRQSRKTIDLQTHMNSNGQKSRPRLHSSSVTVRNRHFASPNNAKQFKDLSHQEKQLIRKQIQRSSLFSKTPIFELPGSRYFGEKIEPRKDFSTGKQLGNKHLSNSKTIIQTSDLHNTAHNQENTLNIMNLIENAHSDNKRTKPPKEHKISTEHNDGFVRFYDIFTTENNLNVIEHNIINQKKDTDATNLFSDDKHEERVILDENDKKLMALLDTLEQEVKHIDLRDKEKEIFNAKIKKIYDNVVRKANSALTITDKNVMHDKQDDDDEVHKLQPWFDTDDESNFIDDPTNNKSNVGNEIDEDLKYGAGLDPEEFDRPLLRNQKLRYDARKKYRNNRYRNNLGQIDRNHVNSNDYGRRRHENGYTSRKSYKNGFNSNYGKVKHRSNSLDYKRTKNYYGDGFYEDPLSSERRKYYQDKLDSMERKLQDLGHYHRRKETGTLRAMKPSVRSENQMSSLYTGRARILHGY